MCFKTFAATFKPLKLGESRKFKKKIITSVERGDFWAGAVF
jgi:hypothetical protein